MPAEYQIDSTCAPYVEELLQDPGLRQQASGNGHAKPASLFHPPQGLNGAVRGAAGQEKNVEATVFLDRAARLIENYRDFGFSAAKGFGRMPSPALKPAGGVVMPPV